MQTATTSNKRCTNTEAIAVGKAMLKNEGIPGGHVTVEQTLGRERTEEEGGG